jgi:hypothetical protein
MLKPETHEMLLRLGFTPENITKCEQAGLTDDDIRIEGECLMIGPAGIEKIKPFMPAAFVTRSAVTLQ